MPMSSGLFQPVETFHEADAVGAWRLLYSLGRSHENDLVVWQGGD